MISNWFKNIFRIVGFSRGRAGNNRNGFRPVEPEKEKEYLSNLELDEKASFDEVKVSYRKLVKRYHPDKFYHDEEKRKYAEEVIRELNEAFVYFEKKNS